MIVGVGHANVTGVPFRSRSSRANFEKVEKEIFFREREREREKKEKVRKRMTLTRTFLNTLDI